MNLLAQAIDEAMRVIDTAAGHGWEAALLAVIVLTTFGAFGWMMKLVMMRHLEIERRTMDEARGREERLAARVSHLEDLIQTELMGMIRQNSETMGRVLAAADSMIRASESLVVSFNRFAVAVEICPVMNTLSKQVANGTNP